MTETIARPETLEVEETGYRPNGGRIPRLSGDIRHLIPKLGLREYWYPLCGTARIKKNKPLRIRMLGDDLCVFRGETKGEFIALNDICPHRGARLSEGDCHYAGTVSCPYHGWTFDSEGKNVAVLSEGPEAIVCGKPGTEARKYPTQVIQGMIYVWMGEGDPAPIEEDVPEEFFRKDVKIFFNDRIHWRTNWEVALENSMDAHVQYLHRDNLHQLLGGEPVRSGGAAGSRVMYTGNGFTSVVPRGGFAPPGTRVPLHPKGWRWPKHDNRKFWSWIFSPLFFPLRVEAPLMQDPKRWVGGHSLPGMFRTGTSITKPATPYKSLIARFFRQRSSVGIFGLYQRQVVPVDEWLTRVWYHHSVQIRSPLHMAWAWFVYFTWGRWHSEYNFSQQDMSVMLHQSFDSPEKLSGTDAEVVQWRKLVVTKHYGGRDYPFDFKDVDTEALLASTSNGSALGNNGAG
jgi:phenylpropionate dioxygenase-like ring-hydroxylating dioxygenase large terminal subunit